MIDITIKVACKLRLKYASIFDEKGNCYIAKTNKKLKQLHYIKRN